MELKYDKDTKNEWGLVILERIITKNRCTHFKCRCTHCGNTTIVRRNKFPTTKSCGCFRRRTHKDNPRFKGCGAIHGGRWWTYMDNAKKRNIPFDITVEEAWKIYESQNGRCALTNLPIYFWKTSKNVDKHSTASLDRIDNTKGYVTNNVHWVHKKVNQIKMDMSLDDFITICRLVVDHANN